MREQSSGWNQSRWIWLTVSVVVMAFGGGIVYPQLFSALGVNAIAPIFSDLIAILAAGEAQQLGRDAYAHNPLDPFNRPHVYGPWWLVTGDLGWVRSDARWLGPLLAISFVGMAAWILRPRSVGACGLAILLLISPPVLLAMERGNNDLVIFVILAAASWGIAGHAWFRQCVAGLLLVLATALKLYPIATMPLLLTNANGNKRTGGIVALTAVLMILALASSWTVYRQVMEMAPEPMTIFGYGLKLSYYVFLTLPEQRGWLCAGALPVLAAVGWLIWRWRHDFWSMVPTTGFIPACFVSGALAWGVCYVTTISFPYRLILLLLPAALCFRGSGINRVSGAHLLLGITIGMLMWSLWTKEHLLVLSADESLFTGPPLAWIALGIEHALAFTVSAALGLALMGWGTRRGQEIQSSSQGS